MARQREVLERDDPPLLWSVLAEPALRWCYRSPPVRKPAPRARSTSSPHRPNSEDRIRGHYYEEHEQTSTYRNVLTRPRIQATKPEDAVPYIRQLARPLVAPAVVIPTRSVTCLDPGRVITVLGDLAGFGSS